MANGIGTGDPRGFNKGCSLKFWEGSLVRQTTEEGRRTYRPKRCGNNNKDEDNSPKSLNDKKECNSYLDCECKYDFSKTLPFSLCNVLNKHQRFRAKNLFLKLWRSFRLRPLQSQICVEEVSIGLLTNLLDSDIMSVMGGGDVQIKPSRRRPRNGAHSLLMTPKQAWS